MKKLNHTFLLSSLMALFLFASCSTSKYGAHFQPSSHPSYAQEKQRKPAEVALQAQQEESATIAAEEIADRSGAEEVQADVLPSVASLKKLMATEMPSEEELTARQQEALAVTQEYLKNMSRKEKRALRREIRKIKLGEYTQELPSYAKEMGVMQEDISENQLVLILLTILLPPLGVYLHQGEINNKFWLTLVLWLLGYFPGLIYGLIVILG